MSRYLISFDDGAMDFLEGVIAEVGEAAHQVVRDAQEANVWITGGGLLRQQATIVNSDGTVKLGDFPETKAVLGGFSIIEVPSKDDALMWAKRFAVACRCAQEVRVVMYDPEIQNRIVQ